MECLGGLHCRLRVFPEAAVAADPGEEAFDNPSLGMYSEADLILRFADDLDIDERRILRFIARVSHVGKYLGHERE